MSDSERPAQGADIKNFLRANQPDPNLGREVDDPWTVTSWILGRVWRECPRG